MRQLPKRIAWAAAAVIAAACGGPATLAELHPDSTCRRVAVVGPLGLPVGAGPGDTAPAGVAVSSGPSSDSARNGAGPADAPSALGWVLPERPPELHRLNAWCAAVGPAAVGGWADPPAGGLVLDSLLVVSWNVHVGGGHLRELVDDIRSGSLTGEPVEHFVLLAQEAYRASELIPEFDPSLPGGSAVEPAPVVGPREDVLRDARELGLAVLYAPNMRNAAAPGGPREDRGNAILATVPLEEPIAIELPVARQRRVALGGFLSGRTTRGEDWRLHVVSVHLENNAAGWANDEAERVRQTRALLRALPDDADAAVAAGDFNTWSRGPAEALVPLMLEAFPDTPPFPPGPTYRRGYGLVRQYLDYMFVRLPEGARARYRVHPVAYNSDHHPLIGWIVFPATEGGPGEATVSEGVPR